jgi:SAM-dependent methyltransferase
MSAARPLAPSLFEAVACYCCGSDSRSDFITAEDDLTGKPGTFRFVRCESCGLVYQHPRIVIERITDYYDDEYIAHRKKTDWGVLTPLYEYVMGKHDRDKDRTVNRYVTLDARSEVLDVGCAVGTFLQRIRRRYGSRVCGVDFKDLRGHASLEGVDFRQGLFYEQDLGNERFDLVTMWHFLEHDYDPRRTLAKASAVLKQSGRLVIEVPRLDSVSFKLYGDRWPGLQAPQHTAEPAAHGGAGRPRGHRLPALRLLPRVLLPVRGRRLPDAQRQGAQPLEGHLPVLRWAARAHAGPALREATRDNYADAAAP